MTHKNSTSQHTEQIKIFENLEFWERLNEMTEIKELNRNLINTAKVNFNCYYNIQKHPIASIINGSSAILNAKFFDRDLLTLEDLKRFIFQGHKEYLTPEGRLSQKGREKLKNILERTKEYCKTEGVSDSVFTNKHNAIHPTTYGNPNNILNIATILQKDGRKFSPWTPIIDSTFWKKYRYTLYNLKDLDNFCQIHGDYGNRESFIFRTMFIAAQLENDEIFQKREIISKNIEKELQDFIISIQKEYPDITLEGSPKSVISTITKISKDPNYAHISQLKDIIRFQFTIGDWKDIEKDTKDCLNVFAEFYKKFHQPQWDSKHWTFIEEIKNKVWDLFATNEKGNYKYIKEKQGNWIIINNVFIPIKEKIQKKSTTAGKYQDIKVIADFNGIPCEIKFVTPQRKEGNEKKESNHSILRLLENINKTARKIWFISKSYIEKRVNNLYKKDESLEKQLTKDWTIDYILQHYTKVSDNNANDEYYINNEQSQKMDELFKKYHIKETYQNVVQKIFQPKQGIETIQKKVKGEIANTLLNL